MRGKALGRYKKHFGVVDIKIGKTQKFVDSS